MVNIETRALMDKRRDIDSLWSSGTVKFLSSKNAENIITTLDVLWVTRTESIEDDVVYSAFEIARSVLGNEASPDDLEDPFSGKTGHEIASRLMRQWSLLASEMDDMQPGHVKYHLTTLALQVLAMVDYFNDRNGGNGTMYAVAAQCLRNARLIAAGSSEEQRAQLVRERDLAEERLKRFDQGVDVYGHDKDQVRRNIDTYIRVLSNFPASLMNVATEVQAETARLKEEIVFLDDDVSLEEPTSKYVKSLDDYMASTTDGRNFNDLVREVAAHEKADMVADIQVIAATEVLGSYEEVYPSLSALLRQVWTGLTYVQGTLNNGARILNSYINPMTLSDNRLLRRALRRALAALEEHDKTHPGQELPISMDFQARCMQNTYTSLATVKSEVPPMPATIDDYDDTPMVTDVGRAMRFGRPQRERLARAILDSIGDADDIAISEATRLVPADLRRFTDIIDLWIVAGTQGVELSGGDTYETLSPSGREIAWHGPQRKVTRDALLAIVGTQDSHDRISEQ